MTTDNAPAPGGYLPNVEISDLDLSTGNVDPTTGIPLSNATANNILMASTFGDGAYAIRLAPIVTLDDAGNTPPGVSGVAGSLPINGVTTYFANADDNTITFNGTSEKTITENSIVFNQVTVNVYDLTNDPNETTPLGTATTNADGTFSVSITRPTPDGLHDLVLVGTDQAGVSGPVATVQLQVETVRPVITGFGLTMATDTGSSHTDGITDNNQPTVTGMGAPGAAVTISITNSSNVTTTFTPIMADSTGLFTFPFPSALPDGTYTVSAVETDVALNTSLPVTFTLKIITSISTPVAPILSAASDSGISSSDNLTNVTQPTFIGTANPDDTVTLLVNGVADGTATADGTTGEFTIQLATPLSLDGTYAVTVTQTDTAGNVSAQSPALSVTLDTTTPVVAATPINANQFGSFTGTVGTITDAHPDGTATINWGDGTISAATLVATSSPTVFNIQGTHAYQTTGSFSISITATDAAGNSASTSSSGTATVTPPAPAITAIALSSNEGQALVNTTVASFTNGAPNPNINDFTATINWGDGTVTTGTIIADPGAAGSFLVEGSHTYADGPNSYTTTITVNAAGVATPSTANGTATVANVPPTVSLGGTTTGFINQIIILPITATDPSSADMAAGFTYAINWGDGTTQAIGASANNGAGLSPTHVYSTAGNYTISVTATDKDGGVGSISRTMQIAAAPSLSNVVINYGQTQRSHIDNISFDLSSTTVPITSLDTTDLALVYDGSTVVSLANAVVTFDASSGHVSINLQGVSLNNGDYQLFVFPGTGVLPINFTKLTGDTDGDGFVTKTDQKTVKADLGATAGSSNYNVNADVNGDGIVNSTDLALLQLDKTKKIQTKVIKLIAGKVIKPVSMHFATMATNATRAVPIQLELVNADPSRPLTLSELSLLGGGANFSFAVLNQTYQASTFTIAPGGTLTIRMYFTPTGAATFSTQLKAQLSNDVQATYGAVIAKFTGKATAPKKSK
jgi:large repetitive protein